MKKLVFPYTVSFGKCDDEDAEIEIELTDDDAMRLALAAETDGGMGFVDNESVQDIYNSVYDAVIESEQECLHADPSPVEDMLSWEDDYDPEEPITDDQITAYLDELYFIIHYPTEFC